MIKKHLTLFLLFLVCWQSAMATVVVIDGIKYALNTYTKTAEVISNDYSGDIVIPATFVTDGTEYAVTSLGNACFYGCSSLTSISIPESVTSLGEFCFGYCRSLTSITIPEGVTSLGEYCFGYCSRLTSITIPESVTSVGKSCFSGCSSLTSITIPESVTSVGKSCFSGCSSLTSIEVAEGNTAYDSRGNCSAVIETATNSMIAGCSTTIIPESVTSLESYCFYGCSSLTSISIPESVTSLGSSCFDGCSSLTSISIPESVTSLGSSCFDGCSHLTSITIPESVTSLGSSCFYGCSSLTSISIPESVTSLGSSCFDGCSSLTSITIPEGVTSLGEYCFGYCSRLTSITIPESVTSVGKSCFSGCSSLTSIEVAEGNTAYDSRGNCSAVIETATNSMIAGCSTTIIPESVTSLESYCFYGCSSLTSISIPESVTSLGSSCFDGCSHLTSITIPESVTSLGSSCFFDCRSLASITIPEGVTSLGYCCFYGCSSLTSISIPESVTSLGSSCFSYCSSLASITIPEGVTSIGAYCFHECSSLASITIPEGVTSIGKYCFSYCSSLTYISSSPETPPTTGDNVFAYCSSLKELYVKSNSIDTYKSASPWGSIENIYALIDSVVVEKKISLQPGETKQIDYILYPEGSTNYKLRWKSNDESVATVSEEGVVTAVGIGRTTITLKATALHGFENIIPVHVYGLHFDYNKESLRATLLPNDYSDNISIPETTIKDMVEYTVDSIAPNCFEGAVLDSLVIPATVQKYGADAFKDTKIKAYTYNGTIGKWCGSRFANAAANPMSLTGQLVLKDSVYTNVVIPMSIKELLPYTFYNCASIDSVEIHSLVTAIGDSCFAGSHIKQFSIQATTLPTLGRDALAANIGTAIVPQDYYGDYYTADGWKDLGNIISSTDKKTGSYFVVDKSLYLLNKETGEIGICNPVDAISQTAEYKGNITLPSEVEYNHKAYPLTTIGPSCFKDNTAVDSIALPATLKTIEASAFSGCKGLGANFLGSLSQWCAIKFDDGTANPMSIKGRLMIGGKELTELTVPSDVTELNGYAFYGCANLKNIEIGEQVENVALTAFAGCTGITDLKLLAYCEVPASVFEGAPLVRVESGNEKFWQSISSDFAATLETAIVSDDYTGMCPSFTNYTKLKNVYLSDKINSITSFSGCSSLTEIAIPQEVMAIGDDAFKNCRNLKTLNLPALYGTSFGSNAFVNCTGLETINFDGEVSDWCSLEFENKYANPMYYAKTVLFQGEELDSLDVTDVSDAKYNNYAFINLKSLRKLVIPRLLGGLSTFEGCSNLQEICLTFPAVSGSLIPGQKGEFDGVDKTTCVLYVPDNVLSEYKRAYVWKDFQNIKSFNEKPVISITLPEKITMAEYDQTTLTPDIKPGDVNAQAFTWTSSDTNVATVNESGIVVSYKSGTAIITATSKSTPSVTASCLVLVGDATGIADITIDDDTEAAYYSLDGVKLASKPQQEGVYIRVKDGKSQKIVVRKK